MSKKPLTVLFLLLGAMAILIMTACPQMFLSAGLNFSASKGVYENRIVITWNELSVPDNDNDGIPDFEIYYYDLKEGGTSIVTPFLPGQGSYSFTDSGISADTVYNYVLEVHTSDGLVSAEATGYAIRLKQASLYSNSVLAQANPVITDTNLVQSTWHKVYLQRGWTYHFQTAGVSGSNPVFSYFEVYDKETLTNPYLLVQTGTDPDLDLVFLCPRSDIYWVRTEADAGNPYQFYAWYE